MVRQAAFNKIIVKKTVDGEQVIDGEKTFTSLQKAQQEGASLLKVLFTPEEMGKFSRFVRLAKRTVPDHVRSREAPNATAKKLKEGFGSVRAFLPFIDVGLSIFVSRASWLKNAGPKSAARKAFKPKRPFSEARLKIMKNLKEIGGAIANSPGGTGGSLKANVAKSALTPLSTEGASGS